MTKNDWYETGDEIKRLVQEAVDSRDFSQLSSTITSVVNDAVSGVQAMLKEGMAQERSGHTSYPNTNAEAAERIRRNIERRRRQEAREAAEKQERKDGQVVPVQTKRRIPGELTGKILKWTGYSMSAMFGMSLAILLLISAATGISMVIPSGILAIFFGTGLYIGRSGSGKVGLAERFRKYQSVLGDRTYCLVEELASAIGKNYKYVQKDLKKMIRRGLFKEGYLAQRETLLITDSSTYRQYIGTQTEYERRVMKEERQKAASGTKPDPKEKKEETTADGRTADRRMTPECREILREGQEYIRHIHECNERIPGQEISAKLDRLELVITRIFREAEKNPDAAEDLKKMMSYYLPTMKKLLDAYCEMDEQPIAGQNVENTKREIEKALDTINTAFENLLDGLFEETAWDISSDISVLHTMLAQEGLMGTDFAQGQGGK